MAKTEHCKDPKSYYLEVQHLIHFDYYYVLVATLTVPMQFKSDGHWSIACALSLHSFFMFKNGVPKCHKKRGKFICKQLVKVSKIYSWVLNKREGQNKQEVGHLC